MINPRTRMAAVAGSMALTMSLAVAPVVMAQDDATEPVVQVLAAFADGRLAEATEPFCAELEAEALGGLGQAGQIDTMGLPFDVDMLIGALDVNVDQIAVSVVDESDDSAVVNVAGPIEIGFDEDGLVTLLTAMMSTEGALLDEDTVRDMLPLIAHQIETMVGGSVEVDENVDVVLEDGEWQVCGDLSLLTEALAGAFGSGDMPEEEDGE